MANGHGPRPWPKAMAQGRGQRPWPKAMTNGHGPRPWPKAMAKGHSQRPWPTAVAQGHGPRPWPKAVAQGHGQRMYTAFRAFWGSFRVAFGLPRQMLVRFRFILAPISAPHTDTIRSNNDAKMQSDFASIFRSLFCSMLDRFLGTVWSPFKGYVEQHLGDRRNSTKLFGNASI